MKKQKQSKTVLLPLADGGKVRIERKKVCSVVITYSLFSTTGIVTVMTLKKDYAVKLSLDEAKRLIYGDEYEKS